MSTAQTSEPSRSEEVTDGIRVQVNSHYLAGQSDPFSSRFVFTYQVTVTNESNESIRLVDRHWVITDAIGQVQEVKGIGVVGETPIILPGSSHSYSSFCPLATEFGSMSGSFGMVFEGGRHIRAKVGTFSLIRPHAIQ